MIASPLLVLTHEYPPRRGGIATYVAETVTAARAQGWDVTVVAPRYAEAIDRPGLRVVPVSARGTLGWIDRLRLWRAVRSLEIDWAETVLWLPEPGPIGLWFYRDFLPLPRPRRLILTLHGSEILRWGRASHRRRRFRTLLTETDRVCVVSGAVEGLFRHLAPLSTVEVERAPGAVGRALQGAIDTTPETRGGDRLRVLTVGRIHPRKGQRAVVEALGRLPASLREKIDYELVGPVRRNRYLAALQRRARTLGVRLVGPAEAPDALALARAYRRADLMVLASREEARSIEGLGLVYLEAAAAACPVVATAAGGAPEAVGPDNGRVVPPNDLDALASALAEILHDAELRRRLGAAGPAWAAKFSWDRVVHQHFDHD